MVLLKKVFLYLSLISDMAVDFNISLINKEFQYLDLLFKNIDSKFGTQVVECVCCKKNENYKGQGFLIDHKYIDEVCFKNYIGKWLCSQECKESFNGWK
ncbi:hypothetical protein G9F72_002425 [Clostridium estertheticum]|uniref:hypothetical protein n=1 Tax=Clostridium estertheticum TaxID=238834 RepID=UPI001CD12D79|nr:hypothetical protein [Clostridium estertheticum]MBZ9685208.1 hypothetical protein [Clostridium estertheticum]